MKLRFLHPPLAFRVVEKLQNRLKRKTHLKRLELHFRGNIEWAKKHADQVAVLLLSIAKCNTSKTMQSKVNTLFEVGEERIYQYLTSGVAEREFHIEGSIREKAAILHKCLIGHIVSFHYDSRKGKKEAFYLDLLIKEMQSHLQISPSSSLH